MLKSPLDYIYIYIYIAVVVVVFFPFLYGRSQLFCPMDRWMVAAFEIKSGRVGHDGMRWYRLYLFM